MADYFDFAGVRSTDLGVYVTEYPPITLPEERADFKPVPGKSGSLTITEGDAVYDDIVLGVNCIVRDVTQIDAIAAWLRGSGALVLGNMPTRYYSARAVNQIELAKVMRGHAHRTFAATFRCKPYRYLYPATSPITITTSPGSVTNSGNVDAEPLIVVTGSGDITLTIGAKTLTITGLASAITIDVAAGLAYNGAVNLSASVSRVGWPLTIPPGVNAVSWTGAVTSVVITPAWRYL